MLSLIWQFIITFGLAGFALCSSNGDSLVKSDMEVVNRFVGYEFSFTKCFGPSGDQSMCSRTTLALADGSKTSIQGNSLELLHTKSTIIIVIRDGEIVNRYPGSSEEVTDVREDLVARHGDVVLLAPGPNLEKSFIELVNALMSLTDMSNESLSYENSIKIQASFLYFQEDISLFNSRAMGAIGIVTIKPPQTGGIMGMIEEFLPADMRDVLLIAIVSTILRCLIVQLIGLN